MGFGSSSKQTSQLVTDQAQGLFKSNQISPQGKGAAGNKATYVESGGVAVGRDLNTGVQIKKLKGDYNSYTTQPGNDPMLIAALATLANRESSPSAPLPPITAPLDTTPGATADEIPLATRISNAVKNGLKGITDFAVTKGTDGSTTINSGVWVVLGIVAVLFVWRKFRRQ